MLFVFSSTKEKNKRKENIFQILLVSLQNMKLSIIIPVYRTQNTLKKCLDSVLNQSFTDYEIILVDDESPDHCPQICDEYAQKDKRISVIHKKNGGLSDARNAGINLAKGEYITFVDSDDAIAEDTLQPLINELTTHPDIDILEYPVQERVGHPNEKLLSFQPKEYEDALSYWLVERAYNHTYAWNKIYKRNLFANIRFPKGKNFEDALTIPMLIGLVPTDAPSLEKESIQPKIKVTNVGLYLYEWNSQGITATATYEDILNLYIGHTLALIHLFKQMKGRESEVLAKYRSSLEDFMVQILNTLLDLYDLSGKYETSLPLMSRVKWLKEQNAIQSYKLKLLNILGYHHLCKLHHLITIIRKYL